MWVSDGSAALKPGEDGFIRAEATTESGDKHYNALWVDGNGINSGEHYWTFKFGELSDRYTAIGLSSVERFGPGYTMKGLMYGGNLHNGGALLVMKFGPGISSNDSVGLLASFTDEPGRLRVYLYQNDKPLGLAFNIESNVLPNAHPVIRFSTGQGSTQIRKQNDNIPMDRLRTIETYSGIEGPWKIQTNSIQIEGDKVSQGQGIHCFDRVTINIKATDNNYNVFLKVINNISFNIKKTNDSWISDSQASSTMMGSSSENMKFEMDISALCQNPDVVTLNVDNQSMTIVKGNSNVTFVRYDDTPGPFNGDPF